MSVWLKPLGLVGNLRIGTSKSIKNSNRVSDWVGFLIWAGWWMRREQVKGVRIFMVLLLPTRICCSAICSLGALIGSMGKSQGALTWDQVISLPTGTEVFTRLIVNKGKKKELVKVKGQLSEIDNSYGKIARQLKTSIKDCIIYIFESNLHSYPLTLTPQRNKFNDIWQFYATIITDLKLATMLAIYNECLIVTNQAAWKREICGVLASGSNQVKGSKTSDLDLLLMPSSRDEGAQSGILFPPQRPGHIIGENIPLGILDGPESLKSWEMVGTPNIIILMDQSEYDENSRGILANLANVRNDRLLPMPEGIPAQPPSGIEMMMFALESQGV